MTEVPHITTIESALNWAYAVLKGKVDDPVREAKWLLGEVTQVKLEYLTLYPNRALTVAEAARFDNLVVERSKGTPVAYLTGRQGFYDVELFVSPDVLIPRPETELLVEKALEWAKGRYTFIVDVGTGSGAIALTLAKHLPQAHVTGIDISDLALQVAQKNAEHLGLTNRVRWLRGDLLRPMLTGHEKADLITANLPYIDQDELQTLEVAKHEPLIALNGGKDGLEYIRRMLADVPSVLKPNGLVLMEIGADQGSAMRSVVETHFPELKILAIEPDLAGHDRLVSLTLV